ncbi:MAG: hypothetical protein ABEI99_02840 [Halobaculum sp.]
MRDKLVDFAAEHGAQILVVMVVVGLFALASDPAAAKVCCAPNDPSCC